MSQDTQNKKMPLPKSTKRKVWILTIFFALLDFAYTLYHHKLGQGPKKMDLLGIGIIAIREIITVVLIYYFVTFIARWRWLQK